MIDDEQFFAWLDGELSGEEAERIAAQVAASPELTDKAERHRRLAAGLRGAFEPVMDSAPPPRFQTAEVVDFGQKIAARETRRWPGVAQWTAMAASLAIGLLVGTRFQGDSLSPVAVDDGRLVAAAALDQALDAQLASSPVAGQARIGLTFRDSSGRICRSFSDASASGLACRDGDAWRVKAIYPAEGQGGDYRMAAGQDPRLAALIDDTISGEPFDAAQERAAMKAGWR